MLTILGPMFEALYNQVKAKELTMHLSMSYSHVLKICYNIPLKCFCLTGYY